MTPDDEAYLRQRVKIELRRRMRAIRSALPREARAARSKAIEARVLELDAVQSAECVATFAAIRSEADPSGIAVALRARGVSIAYPRITDEGLVLHLAEPGQLVAGIWDIPEPTADAPRPEQVDVILVPGLAFDPRGHRIGYGKGYYDRLLAAWPDAFCVGLGFDFQLVSEAPNLPHDVVVQCVVTDKRTLMVPV